MTVTAISSVRPHSRSPEFARNQSMAWRSWQWAFSKIIYVGIEEPELHSQKTSFVAAEDWPRIQTLAEVAANQPVSVLAPVAIVNADIVIGQRFSNVRNMFTYKWCGSSRRYHFDPHTPNYERATLIEADRGRDIFIAQRRIWKQIAEKVPSHLRIGHQQWDAWVTDYFNEHYKSGFFDFTGMKCIFHPKHEDRQMPYANEIAEAQLA